MRTRQGCRISAQGALRFFPCAARSLENKGEFPICRDLRRGRVIPVSQIIYERAQRTRKVCICGCGNVIKNRGHVPSDEAATKLIFLALRKHHQIVEKPTADLEDGRDLRNEAYAFGMGAARLITRGSGGTAGRYRALANRSRTSKTNRLKTQNFGYFRALLSGETTLVLCIDPRVSYLLAMQSLLASRRPGVSQATTPRSGLVQHAMQRTAGKLRDLRLWSV
jgi:hypothetical protein